MTDQPKIPDEVMKAATAAVMLLNQRKPEVNEQAEECITEAFRDFVRVPEGVKYRDYIKLADREKRLEELLKDAEADMRISIIEAKSTDVRIEREIFADTLREIIDEGSALLAEPEKKS